MNLLEDSSRQTEIHLSARSAVRGADDRRHLRAARGNRTSSRVVEDPLDVGTPAGVERQNASRGSKAHAVSQIAKSVVFRSASGASILVIANGTNRVAEKQVAELVGETIARATSDFARQTSGYAIGGLPPVVHRETPKVVLIDTDLMQYDETPHAVVRLTPADLVSLSGGRLADVKS